MLHRLVTHRGFTLLEALVALVILGVVAGATLPLLGSAVRAAQTSREWATATAYAEEGMELAKLDLASVVARGSEELEGGFERNVRVAPQARGFDRVTVSVRFPEGGEFRLERLVEVR